MECSFVATTYAVASKLPPAILDFLLLLPHRLALLRESLQTARDLPPQVVKPTSKAPTVLPTSTKTPLSESQHTDAGPTPSESEADSSAYTSEADGETSAAPSQAPTRANTIADSWVSVKDDE